MSNGHGSKNKCSNCGCKIRGSNHADGSHCKGRVKIEKQARAYSAAKASRKAT